MTSPTVDIIIPVWNNPFETRACLTSLLAHSPEARLIVVDNGSNRETELVLEEFSESLGEKALFMTTERNLGLIPSINRGLASSDADCAVIVRPQVAVPAGWLDALLEAASIPGVGIVSPVFCGNGAPEVFRPVSGCTRMETFSLSFAALLLNGRMLRELGGFDESLDGGEWCLRDCIRRAEAKDYLSCVTARSELICGPETIFGSPERRLEQARQSRERYLSRWGIARHYCLYFGKDIQGGDLSATVDSIVAGARRGHRYTLLLHRKQFKEFCKHGWNGLHTGITICPLPMFGAQRSLARQVSALQTTDPDMIAVRGTEGVLFPGNDLAIAFGEIATIRENGAVSES